MNKLVSGVPTTSLLSQSMLKQRLVWSIQRLHVFSAVSSERANLGAVSNRMASTMANLDQIRVNSTASKGRIADADFAAETANLAKGQILQQGLLSASL